MKNTLKIGFWPWLVALSVVFPVLWFVPFPMIFRYAILGITLAYYFLRGGFNQSKILFFLLILACVISIIFNDIPPKYQPWPRFVIFVGTILLISPAVSSNLLDRFRVNTFNLLMKLCCLVSVISLFCYFAGFNAMRNDAVGQGGATVHSMIMGPIAGLSILYTLFYLLILRQKRNKNGYLYIIVLGISFIMLLLARSRGAFAATLMGTFALFLFISKFKGSQFSKFFPLIALLTVICIPIWTRFSDSIVEKFESGEETGSYTSSRDALWEDRFDEFKKSPIYGIGFSYVPEDNSIQWWYNRFTQANHNNPEADSSIFKGKAVEPGSGWLGVLSMTGLLGFCCFSLIVLNTLNLLCKLVKRPTSDKIFSLYGAILIFFSLHLIIEGYVLSAGNFLFFIFWLLFGATYGQYNLEHKNLR